MTTKVILLGLLAGLAALLPCGFAAVNLGLWDRDNLLGEVAEAVGFGLGFHKKFLVQLGSFSPITITTTLGCSVPQPISWLTSIPAVLNASTNGCAISLVGAHMIIPLCGGTTIPGRSTAAKVKTRVSKQLITCRPNASASVEPPIISKAIDCFGRRTKAFLNFSIWSTVSLLGCGPIFTTPAVMPPCWLLLVTLKTCCDLFSLAGITSSSVSVWGTDLSVCVLTAGISELCNDGAFTASDNCFLSSDLARCTATIQIRIVTDAAAPYTIHFPFIKSPSAVVINQRATASHVPCHHQVLFK